MRTIALPVLSTLLGLLRSRAFLHLEILALRQQLAMVNQTPRKRLRFHWGQRLFWVWLYRLWPGCLQTLQVFKPDTLVRWHRKGFRLYWTWKSHYRTGEPPGPTALPGPQTAAVKFVPTGEVFDVLYVVFRYVLGRSIAANTINGLTTNPSTQT